MKMMENRKENRNYLGSVVCRYCGEVMDLIDAEKVMIYYSQCGGQKCSQEHREMRDRKTAF